MDTQSHVLDELTPREQQVARLMAKGFTNPQIADELGITFNTAKWHVSQVIAKTGASSREEAVHAWQSRSSVANRVRRSFGLGFLHPLAKWTIASTAIVAVALAAALLVAALNRGEGETPVAPGPSPTAEPTPTPEPTETAANNPCDPQNLVGGFLVLDESEPVPGCVQRDSFVTPNEITYELALPPGPYRQGEFASQDPGEEERLGYSYFLRDAGGSESPAFVIHRTRAFTIAPPIVRGEDAEPWDRLPGPGVLVQRTGSQVLAWVEDMGPYSVSYELEMFPAPGFSLEQAVDMLVYFDPMRSETARWESETGTFVTSPWAPWLYPDSVTTGVPSVDAVLSAVRSGESLEPLIDTVLAPCVQNPPPGLLFPPTCDEGQPEGELVPAFVTGTCPSDEWGAIDASNTILPDLISQVERVDSWLFAVAEAPAALPSEVAYFVIFTSGERITTLALTEDGVAGIGGGGNCAAGGDEFSAYLQTATDWLLPPLYPIPPG